jgi:DNA-nicking Smr family endonuclease
MKKDKKKVAENSERSDFSTFFNGEAGPSFTEQVNHFLPENSPNEVNNSEPASVKKTFEKFALHPPESQLDLHRLKAAEAERKMKSYLLTQKQRGRKSVRIITGKGLHSRGQSVLRDVVEAVLLDFIAAGIVAGYQWEKQRKQESGAVNIYL